MSLRLKKKISLKSIISNKNIILLSITAIIIFLELGVLTLHKKTVLQEIQPATQGDLRKYAQEVLRKCKDAPYQPSCFDKEIPKLMQYISMRDAFGVAKIVSETNKEYTHCHVLGHILSGIETKKDPSKWKEVITQCPAAVCNNGCLHGPLLTRFNKESLTDEQIDKLKPDLKDVCDPRGNWHPLRVETSMCYHGMGHLNMYITGADVKKSVELCKYESIKPDGQNFSQTCTQGVFMQIYQAIEPEDIALVKNIKQTKESVPKFCSQFTGESRIACHNESWALYQKELENPIEANKFCSYSTDPTDRRKCFSTVLSNITVIFLLREGDIHKFDTYCRRLDKDELDFCYGEAAMRLIQVDAVNINIALNLCKIAPNDGKQCYSDMIRFGITGFQPNSKEYKEYCNRLPSPWNEKCLIKDYQF